MSKKISITFVYKENNQEIEKKVTVLEGTTVLEAARQNDIPIEGACEGSLACSTCHVILEKTFYDKIEEASEDEEDMLDLAFGLTPTSRLGCQIIVNENLQGMKLKVPDEVNNLS